MRVIRPSALAGNGRRRTLLLSATMLAVGVLAAQLTLLTPASTATGVLAASAALGLGVGTAWLLRALRPNRARSAAEALAGLLAPTLDDSYTLLLAPTLPVRDAARLDGVLVGPAGVRVLTVRDWDGRYRVRGRGWEFDARGRRGWITCRTNPSFEAASLSEGFSRWASDAGLVLPDVALRPAIAFPNRRSRIVLEEPIDEVITTDNAPWWANTIGRVQRLDPSSVARVVAAVMEAAEARSAVGRRPAAQDAG
ncbi:MAG TPA: hypothetical protein VFV59_10495 [Candidatus Limnocylindria bacterium]|nr:hypothetical protein [Candidatus Limnocylindria bacterium]